MTTGNKNPLRHALDRPARRRKSAQGGPRLSRLQAPPGMATELWQAALRRQYGREQKYVLENLGAHPVFSEFRAVNPASGGRYRVAIRGTGLGENYCSCPDFATNEIGTCKHIEFTLAALERRRGGKKALALGYRPAFSELYLRYGAKRSVHFRPGTDCPAGLLSHARRLFDEQAGWALPQERFAQLDAFLSLSRERGRAEVQAQAGALASSEAAKAQGRDAAAATPGETEIAAARGSQGGPQPAADPWQGLVEAGAEFLSRLAALASPAGSAAQQASAPAFALETEPASGRRYLRFPVPDAETLSTLAGVLRKILPRADAD